MYLLSALGVSLEFTQAIKRIEFGDLSLFSVILINQILFFNYVYEVKQWTHWEEKGCQTDKNAASNCKGEMACQNFYGYLLNNMIKYERC